ncbi:MAG: SCO family protein [Magnetococcales bacterium]|nr:SCO family protein [Magnetococcales bacterium]
MVKERESRWKIRVLQAVLLLGALLTSFFLWQNRPVTPPLLIPEALRGLLVPEPKQLTSFDLVDHFGKPYRLQRLQGQWTFLFFGYTHCPDVCPTSLSFLAEVFEQLKAHPEDLAHAQATFVSVDPKRDSTEVLKEYVPFFHEKFLGVTGTTQAIDGLAKQVWAQYQLSDEVDEEGNYAVDHTAAFFLIDPKGRLYAVFSTAFQRDPETMAKAFHLIRPRVE